jgi:hypothetical protein
MSADLMLACLGLFYHKLKQPSRGTHFGSVHANEYDLQLFDTSHASKVTLGNIDQGRSIYMHYTQLSI